MWRTRKEMIAILPHASLLVGGGSSNRKSIAELSIDGKLNEIFDKLLELENRLDRIEKKELEK